MSIRAKGGVPLEEASQGDSLSITRAQIRTGGHRYTRFDTLAREIGRILRRHDVKFIATPSHHSQEVPILRSPNRQSIGNSAKQAGWRLVCHDLKLLILDLKCGPQLHTFQAKCLAVFIVRFLLPALTGTPVYFRSWYH